MAVLAVAGVLTAVARTGGPDESTLRLATGRPPADGVVVTSTSTSTSTTIADTTSTTAVTATTASTAAPNATVGATRGATSTTAAGRRTTTTSARPTTTSPPSAVQPTTTTEAREAPAFLSASGDLDAGRVTVTFDRAVDPGTIARAPMYLVVYGADSGCSRPDGNGQRFVAGGGSPTVTVEATSLVRGITYVTVSSGFVESTHGRVANRAQGCTAIRVD